MNWYYESGGQQHGPIPDSELDRLIAEGKITLDTLVWREGLSGWAPLRSTRPAPSGPGPAAASGGEVPPPGYIRCSLTGKYCPPSEIIYIEGRPYSAEAKPQVMQSLQTGTSLPGGDFNRTGPPWEQRATLGLVKATWETIKAVLTQPSHALATMRREGGLGSPLLFLLVTAGIGGMISQLYSVFFQGAMFGMLASMGAGTGPQTFPGVGTSMAMQIGVVVIMPVLTVFGAFVYAGLAHLALKMLKGANQPFETTMRAVCYTTGAGGALYVIPFCGAYIGWIWGLVALCIGLGKAHDTSTEKGVGGALLPMLFCCLIYLGLMGLVVAVAATAGAVGSGR